MIVGPFLGHTRTAGRQCDVYGVINTMISVSLRTTLHQIQTPKRTSTRRRQQERQWGGGRQQRRFPSTLSLNKHFWLSLLCAVGLPDFSGLNGGARSCTWQPSRSSNSLHRNVKDFECTSFRTTNACGSKCSRQPTPTEDQHQIRVYRISRFGVRVEFV